MSCSTKGIFSAALRAFSEAILSMVSDMSTPVMMCPALARRSVISPVPQAQSVTRSFSAPINRSRYSAQES